MEKIYTRDALAATVEWVLARAGEKRIWLLEGNVGAGKTTLIAALMQALQSLDEVSSPTFSIINEYALPVNASIPYRKVYHADLYRLKDIDEVIDAGVEDILNDASALCIIEWPEIASVIMPQNTLTLEILHWEDNSRKIILK